MNVYLCSKVAARISERTEMESEMWETNSRMFNDALGNYHAVKTFGKEECETARLADYQNAVHLAEYEAGRLESLLHITQSLCNTMMQATLLLLAGQDSILTSMRAVCVHFFGFLTFFSSQRSAFLLISYSSSSDALLFHPPPSSPAPSPPLRPATPRR